MGKFKSQSNGLYTYYTYQDLNHSDSPLAGDKNLGSVDKKNQTKKQKQKTTRIDTHVENNLL